jgi:LCP family protein required for cell wall assembly
MHSEIAVDHPGQQLRASEIDADNALGRHVGHYNRRMPGPDDQGERPEYRVYGGGGRRDKQPRGGPAEPGAGGAERPDYNVYRARPRGLFARLRGQDDIGEDSAAVPPRGGGRRIGAKRVIVAVVAAVLGWLLLSFVLFLVSAQIQQGKVSGRAKAALSDGGALPTSANTILILGSDQRLKGSKEPGANPKGPSRSDTILLMRVGGGKSARLSIPRDTDVNIPGHGLGRINSAFAYGGAALSIRTIESFLHIKINHLVEVNFGNFPEFIDTLGGVDVKTGCVLSLINGGTKNGGYTLRLRRGSHHLDGKAALALARTRKNRCPGKLGENDLTRAKRQQQILGAMKDRLTSPLSIFRLPWVSWAAPQAIRSDMGGFSLLGMFAAIATTSSAKPTVLPVTPNSTGGGLTISPDRKRRAVARFLKG